LDSIIHFFDALLSLFSVDGVVLFVFVLLGLMSVVDTLNLSIRVAGVLTKRLAIALSLFNILMVFSRMSNMIQAPFVGGMIDSAVNQVAAQGAGPLLETANEITAFDIVLPKFRMLVLAYTFGAMIGAFLTPTFQRIFSAVILDFEQRKSMARAAAMIFNPVNLLRLKLPGREHFQKYMDWRRIPKGFLFWHLFVTTFYTIGVLSSLLAGAMLPEFRATAATLSGLVNGIATFLLFMLVDPTAALITDQCILGKRPETDIKVMNFYLIWTKIAGTLLAQLFLVPMAEYVGWAAKVVHAFSGSGTPAI
jgi:hypothetical protein